MLKRDGVICGPLVCQVRKGKVFGGKGGGAGGLVVTLTTCGLKGMEKLFIESVRIDKSAHAGAVSARRITATANSFFRISTAFTRHSSGVRFPPRRLLALKTSSQLGPAPFRRNAVSRSNHQSMVSNQVLASALH